jgi:hypothetical protein
MKLVSVVSPVSLSLSAEMSSSSDEYETETNSNIRFMMSQYVNFLLVTILLTHLDLTQHTPNLTPSDSVIQVSAVPGMLQITDPRGMD